MTERRETRQQKAIWKVLADAGRPLSIDELHEQSAMIVNNLGLSTVYRAIRRWEEDADIVAVTIPDQPARYELAETAARHHHHFHCAECDRLFDVFGCPGGLSDLLPAGFELRSHQIMLEGICADCAGSNGG